MKKVILAVVIAVWGVIAQAETFQTLQGKATSIAQQMQSGKWAVVMVWSNFCHVCNEEASKYESFHAKYKDKDAVVIGLSVDGKASTAEKFVKRHKLNFLNLVGDDRSVASFYQGVSGQQFFATPSLMIFDTKGKIRAVQAGAVPPEVVEKFIKNPEDF